MDIAADPNTVYALITDLPTMAEVAAETTSMERVNGDAARPGARFKGTNSHGTKSWSTTCTVTDAEPGIPAGWATGVKDRKAANVEHIAHTLQRLKDKAEAAS